MAFKSFRSMLMALCLLCTTLSFSVAQRIEGERSAESPVEDSELFHHLSASAVNPSSARVQAASASGVVNAYASVTAFDACGGLTVDDPSAFAAGDRILVIQMQGASANTTNGASFGDLDNLGGAGLYEFATVTAVSGNTLSLAGSLVNSYDVAGAVQAVRVLSDTDIDITGVVTAQPWNGATGGVVVLEADNAINFAADIDVSLQGFRGGGFCRAFFGCNDQNYVRPFTPTCQGGQKGEGIAQYVAGQEAARGKWVNGGGGSNRGNSGGAGGANFGAGGAGGNEYSGCGNTGVQGVGGQALTYGADRIFMGGGGGGGYADNNRPVTPGANGGGIVILRADVVNGAGFSILANGGTVSSLSNDEGAGGAGAGGAVLLDVGTFNSGLIIEADGGSGGGTFNTIFTNQCHGPGGGGGGGALLFTNPVPSSVSFSAIGGPSGLVLHPTSPCFNTSFGAAAGVSGGSFGPVAIAEGAGGVLGVDAGDCESVYFGFDSTNSCVDLLADVTGGTAPFTYDWSTGDMSATITVCPTANTTYYVTVTDAGGCTAVDSVQVIAVDVTCGNNGKKVLVCHVPPGNPANAHEICISKNAVGAHVDGSYGHDGCHVGPCEDPCLASGNLVEDPADNTARMAVDVAPSPFQDATQLEFRVFETGTTVLEVFDLAGNRVALLFEGEAEAGRTYKTEFQAGQLEGGVYLYRLRSPEGVLTGRMVRIAE